MKRLYNVTLTEEERASLLKLISTGTGSAKRLTHARILLKADTSTGQQKRSDPEIAKMLEVGVSTVFRVVGVLSKVGSPQPLNHATPNNIMRQSWMGCRKRT